MPVLAVLGRELPQERAPDDCLFLRGRREPCAQHSIVLVADEIQSGIGRTATFYAIEHSGVEPDPILLAKSVGGGLPISAVLDRAEIADAPAPGRLGGICAGSPLACAANAVPDVSSTKGSGCPRPPCWENACELDWTGGGRPVSADRAGARHRIDDDH
ncbi:aminotransferase class III-fold pyridoxal phosphate-dependent enzyme [Deinococcus marmoris]|uniref:aminotransferase class III-fold pyridoxal phosphate-dependent enzyme n=1 Tax=Deinococcus marmoris TaxID=249408 RepID=UPI00096A769C|nr:aminotransferase class III-fold pyridoxal phosphate-dependent enzyme [Deinococcus marmoris]